MAVEEGSKEGLLSAAQATKSVPSAEVKAKPAADALSVTKLESWESSQTGRSSSERWLLCALVFLLVFIVVGGVDVSFRRLEESSKGKEQDWGVARAQKKLREPVLILISSDGFRWGYNYKVPTPNIERLRVNGTEAETGLIPVFPSLTFPNHYSIATGLYPAWHGIVSNYFTDSLGDPFSPGNLDPKWWLGEPIWVTVTKNDLQASTYFWPGSEVKIEPWTCPPQFCMAYNQSVSYEERVDRVLGYFDLPSEEMPRYMSLYFESPDEEGHQVGPDAPEISAAVAEIDSLIGRLIAGLEERGVFEDVTIILLADHGMVSTCDAKIIYVEDFKPWVNVDPRWVDSYGATFTVRPPPEVNAQSIYSKMKEALASGKIENGDFLDLYSKEELPERLLYASSDRVEPIVGIPAEGFKVAVKRSNKSKCGGAHGYDNTLQSMRPIFIAHGPQFARGRKVPSFNNVELYNVFTSILKLKVTAPNNGSALFPSSVLLSAQ